MSKNILVPVDGSGYSSKALEFACDYAAKTNDALHLLYVMQPVYEDHTLVLGAAAVTIHDSTEQLEVAARKVIDASCQIAATRGCAVVDSQIKQGNPAKVIIQTAKDLEVDMIILGSRGLGDLSGLIMGSVSHKVNHLAPCTCITVR